MTARLTGYVYEITGFTLGAISYVSVLIICIACYGWWGVLTGPVAALAAFYLVAWLWPFAFLGAALIFMVIQS